MERGASGRSPKDPVSVWGRELLGAGYSVWGRILRMGQGSRVPCRVPPCVPPMSAIKAGPCEQASQAPWSSHTCARNLCMLYRVKHGGPLRSATAQCATNPSRLWSRGTPRADPLPAHSPSRYAMPRITHLLPPTPPTPRHRRSGPGPKRTAASSPQPARLGRAGPRPPRPRPVRAGQPSALWRPACRPSRLR
jgi:hypothetical protein